MSIGGLLATYESCNLGGMISLDLSYNLMSDADIVRIFSHSPNFPYLRVINGKTIEAARD